MIRVHTFNPDGYFGSNCFVIDCNGEYAVVDPSVSIDKVKAKISDIDLKLKYILLTHCHFDHIYAINSWTTACPSATVIIGRDDGVGLSNAVTNCYLGFLGVNDGYYGPYTPVDDGQRLTLGGELVRVISCPGHTAGGVSYRIGEHLFVGDTLFDGGGYGRCDLPSGDFSALERSIIKIFTHEPDGKVYSGHGANTTLQNIINYFM